TNWDINTLSFQIVIHRVLFVRRIVIALIAGLRHLRFQLISQLFRTAAPAVVSNTR
ncbi:hypothetical protein BYT27DRAFT_7127222, partial [Phlegmacium glaucopus]